MPSCVKSARLLALAILVQTGCFGTSGTNQLPGGDDPGTGGSSAPPGSGGNSAPPGGGVAPPGQICTDILATAIIVHVVDLAGRPIVADGVQFSVNGGPTTNCDRFDDRYACHEQGGGTYRVIVETNGEQQEAQVFLEHDGCHVVGALVELTFEFDVDGVECEEDRDCVLVDPRCCACGVLTPQEASAAPIGASGGVDCDAQDCSIGCPDIIQLPLEAVARCIRNTCQAVDITDQFYTQCTTNADCVLVPTQCCGVCGYDLDNAYAVNRTRDEEFFICHETVACTLIGCPQVEATVEAICGNDDHCYVRGL